ncbi:hypothetical protein ABE237_07520 [Brevibacillus formosus]|uniref:hypothetical protein n=1 Tax=Brevibacillus formosus TaxID=54913 RepID=UPI0018CECF33|nr:hypothetical protein [Brevibacillus formosus]MBG9943425.1 hypothetical protein [Brevibacillus formosus]
MKKLIKSTLVTALLLSSLSVVGVSAESVRPLEIVPSNGHGASTDNSGTIQPLGRIIRDTFTYDGSDSWTFNFDEWEPGEEDLRVHVQNLGDIDMKYKVSMPSGRTWFSGTLKPNEKVENSLYLDDPWEFGDYRLNVSNRNGVPGKVKLSASSN